MKILIVSAYMPCIQSIERVGEGTYLKQLWREYMRVKEINTDPRKQAWKYLSEFITQYEQEYHIILAWTQTVMVLRTIISWENSKYITN